MDAFQNLPLHKQDTILNAGFSCFAKNGYNKASMADIAAEAGVSKASLFHYFGSKQSMYLYLYNFAVDVITKGITQGMKAASEDFFERIWQAQRIKMDVIAQYAGMFNFLRSSLEEDSAALSAEMKQQNQKYLDLGFAVLLEGINWAKFKPGINAEMVTNTVTWVSQGYIQSNFGKKSVEEMTKEVHEYLQLLKTTLYREEYL